MEIPKITLYDTLGKKGRTFVVIGETKNYFILKERTYQFNEHCKRVKLSKEEYYSGASGYRRLNFSRVSVSRLTTNND